MKACSLLASLLACLGFTTYLLHESGSELVSTLSSFEANAVPQASETIKAGLIFYLMSMW